ncbi:hypothetical protein CGCA056_v000949 [Colletotrichum aenigma]|uniref:uncharacterized protein n=1 Tax=Colletotrichum aenigma TaxID=1215731 RepID=UPI00187304F8|nr:uncharacterized protein CGCA056_v000949 [Colletotrichum aenigma]KAF5527118.1 hypothetical protein CGCA056_v000949 [Colletotrichum aenigma]
MQNVARASRQLREDVLHIRWRKLVLGGEPKDLEKQIDIFLNAPQPSGRMRRTLSSIADSLHHHPRRQSTEMTWERHESAWRCDVPSALPTKIIRLLMEMRRLDKMYLDIINFDPSQNVKFQSQLSKNMFSTSLRTLWIQADDQIVARILGVLQKNTLEAFGTSGLQT